MRGEPPERTWGPCEALAGYRLGGTYETGPSPKLDGGARRRSIERAPGCSGDTGGSGDRAGDPPTRHIQWISPPHRRIQRQEPDVCVGSGGGRTGTAPPSPFSLHLSMDPALGETCPPLPPPHQPEAKTSYRGHQGASDRGVPIGGWSSGRVTTAWPARRAQVAM
ncbi:hypothetical protein NDU88_001835 [Pleurodeles waltl]|uniref:Uncharacterized protein n=1 Tax=Pleurodeles waltl TaxID=8319 RepID=A0AAV7W284_PLEWA|nr:hypothetical protein NDU88_001835 [Pleurodeles waltl]